MGLSTVRNRVLLQIDAAGVVVCLAASLGAYFAVFGPLVQHRPILISQRQELAIQTEKYSKLKASTLMLKNHLAGLQEQLAQSENKLESVGRINQRVAQVAGFLDDYGLQVEQVQIKKTCAGSRCDLVPITITGKSRYKQCAAFLHEVYRTFPDISLASFELRGNPAGPGQPGTFRFELFWVVMPEIKMRNDLSAVNGQTYVRSNFVS